jgi:WD40 repeat protein
MHQARLVVEGMPGIASLAWSPDGKTLVSGHYGERFVRSWTEREFKATVSDEDHVLPTTVNFLRYTKDGKGLIFGGGRAGVLDLASGKPRAVLDPHDTTFTVALNSDEKLMVTGGYRGSHVQLWKTDGTPVHRLAGRGLSKFAAGWSPDGKTLGWGDTAQGDPFAGEAPLERGFQLSELEFTRLPAENIEKTYQKARIGMDRMALIQGKGPKLEVRKNGALQATCEVYRSPYCATFLSPDRLAAGYDTFALYDANTGARLREFKGHTSHVAAVAPCPGKPGYLLTACNDMVLRVWHPDQDEPLVSLFVTGHDWIAWTPQGYYAASPGGEKLMGWHVNNGPDRLGSFYPATQFRKALYRPDVIKKLLAAGSVSRALELADQETGRKTEPVELENLTPPIVAITSPRAGSTAKERIEITAEAVSRTKLPIKSLRLMVDGRPYEGDLGRKFAVKKEQKQSDTWTAKLTPGKHRISVVAETELSQATSPEIEIVATSAEPDRSDLPSLYVLSVGVARYRNRDLMLRYTANDAETIARAFKEHSKDLYRKVEVKLLTDENATRGNILDGLDWLRKQMTQRDVSVFFYSGHGARDEQGRFYLLPVESDPDKLRSTAVANEDLKTGLAALPGRVLVLLDACHAGATGGDRRKAALTDDLVRDLATDDYGVVTMCSSMGREFSLESDKHKGSFFTLALVEGLAGKAGRSPDGAVYLHKLDVYVTDRVKELSDGKQHPVTAKPTSVRSFPLTRP